jgi:hypothetical protein
MSLTREQVERIIRRFCGTQPIGDCMDILETDADLRKRIAELEQALRLHLAVSPDDPLLLTPIEQQLEETDAALRIAVEKRLAAEQQLAAMTQERNDYKEAFSKRQSHTERELALEQQLAALPPALTWTTSQPTVAGWYWRRIRSWAICEEIVDIAGAIYVQRNGRIERDDNLNGEWSSHPLLPPADQTRDRREA